MPSRPHKIGVNFFDGIFSLVNLPITIIAADNSQYDGGLINAVNFESVWPTLYDIKYNNSVSLPDWSGATFLIGATQEIYLDLYENESISQNWKFQDLSNFTAQGAFSREFRLPFSETNKEALGALFDNNVEQGAENYFFYKLPAEIRVDKGVAHHQATYAMMTKPLPPLPPLPPIAVPLEPVVVAVPPNLAGPPPPPPEPLFAAALPPSPPLM